MILHLRCPCGRVLRASDALVGRRARCPNCQRHLIVPDVREIHRAAEGDGVEGSLDEPGGTQAAWRGQLHWFLALAVLPLLWTSLFPPSSASERLEQTLQNAPPEAVSMVQDVRSALHITGPTPPGLVALLPKRWFEQLPGDRIEGALLPRESYLHWAMALMAGAMFVAAVLVIFPQGDVKPMTLIKIGAFTGTAGIFLLLSLQFLAFGMRGQFLIGVGPLAVVGYLLKFIAFSYSAALDHRAGFVTSLLAFTFGVGACEEICKALPILWKLQTDGDELDWHGALLWGAISGVGFGISEAIHYCGHLYNGVEGGSAYLVRFTACVALHVTWAAAAGLALQRHRHTLHEVDSIHDWLAQVVAVMFVPVLLHGLYDTLLREEIPLAALGVALASFAWLSWQISLARQRDGEREGAGMASSI